MPIYEYKCSKCGRVSEFLESSAERKVKICPHCGGKKLQKQISVFAPRIAESASKRCIGCSDDTCPHSGQ